MDKKIAEEIVRVVRLYEEPGNILTEITGKIENEEEHKKIRKIAAEIMALVVIDLLGHVVSEYPELHPYKDYFKDAGSEGSA